MKRAHATPTAALRRAPFAALSGALLATLLAGCSSDAEGPQAAPAPPLPPLVLQPMLPELKQLAAAAAAPAAGELHEALELSRIALQLEAADERTAALAERSLLESPAAIAVLEPALVHEDPAVRRRAAWLLGRTQRPLAQFPLLFRLKYESDPETVYWIADALFRCGNDHGMGWLRAGIENEATAQAAGVVAIDVCRSLSLPLSEQPTWAELGQHLRELDRRWRRSGTGAHQTKPPDRAAIDARAAAHLIATEGTQLRPVDEARYVLVRTGRLVLPLLQRVLGAQESYLRTMALQVLAEIGPPAHDLAPAVLPLLADPLTASYAIRTLGEIGATDAAPHLRAHLDAPDVELRAAAAGALGLLRDRDSLPRLQAMLADTQESKDVRVQAAFACLCFGDDAAATGYLDTLQQEPAQQAILGQLRDRLARHQQHQD